MLANKFNNEWKQLTHLPYFEFFISFLWHHIHCLADTGVCTLTSHQCHLCSNLMLAGTCTMVCGHSDRTLTMPPTVFPFCVSNFATSHPSTPQHFKAGHRTRPVFPRFSLQLETTKHKPKCEYLLNEAFSLDTISARFYQFCNM